MAKTPEEMAQAMLDNLEEKTGKTLDAWLGLVEKAGLPKHGQIVKLLKSDHGVTHGYANLIAHKALESHSKPPSEVELVDSQYAGTKAGLRPVYESIVAAVGSFGGDVEIAPKKTYVSLRRSKQFALVQPSTRTRVDLGLKLAGVEPDGRLEASGSFNAMVSHRVRLTALEEVDDELVAWLRQAYDQG